MRIKSKQIEGFLIYMLAFALPFGNVLRIPLITIGDKTFVLTLFELIIMGSIIYFYKVYLNNIKNDPISIILIIWIVVSIINCTIMIFANRYMTTGVYLKNMYYIITWSIAMFTYIIFSGVQISSKMREKVLKIYIASSLLFLTIIIYWEYKFFNIRSIITLTSFRLGAFEGLREPYANINTNTVGVLFSFVFILLHTFKPSVKILILKIICFVSVLLTSSRESILLLVCAIFVLFLIEPKYRKVFFIEFSALVTVFISIYYLSTQYIGEYNGFLERYSSFTNPRLALETSRVEMWEKILNHFFEIKSAIVIGYGPEGVLHMSRILLNESIYNGDNSIIGVFISQGIIGLVLFIIFIAVLTIKLYANYKYNQKLPSKCMISLITAYIVTSLFSPRFLWPYNPINATLLFFCAIFLQIDRENYFEATDR